MSIEQQIADLSQQFQETAVPWNAKIAELNVARDLAVQAAQEQAAQLASKFNPQAIRVLYIDPANGDDANDGTTAPGDYQAANAVQSWERLFDLVDNSGRHQVRLCNDVVADTIAAYNSFNPLLEIAGYDTLGVASERRSITFQDATNNATHVGGLATFGALQLRLRNLDLVLDSLRDTGAFMSNGSAMHVTYTNGTISKANPGAAIGEIFRPVGLGVFHWTNVVHDPSAEGNIIHNIGAGADPNANPLYLANFTSA